MKRLLRLLRLFSWSVAIGGAIAILINTLGARFGW